MDYRNEYGLSVRRAEMWANAHLAEGPRPVVGVLADAKLVGISKCTLIRAKYSLGIVSQRHGFGSDGVWSWIRKGDALATARMDDLIGKERHA